MSKILKATKVTNEELVLTNCVYFHPEDFHAQHVKHVQVKTGPAHRYVFAVGNHPSIPRGKVAFSMPQRKWTQISLDQEVEVTPHNFDPNSQYISVLTVEIDFHDKKKTNPSPYDSDHMARMLQMTYPSGAFTVGQEFAFMYQAPDEKRTLFACRVKEMEAADLSALAGGGGGQKHPKSIHTGMLMANSNITFDKVENSMLNLAGGSRGKVAYRSIINPDWNFERMGIGGLDREFSAIFRRAFASRVFPPEFIEQLGMKHVRGILLFGPPGTGKTLMARQIGQMLNAREPKIVNGPQILDKYVGESEANIRKLFADAEEEWKKMGPHSGLHIIIFDEIDAICKQRGSVAGSSAVHDTVVNQLLSKIDGVDQLNNILVIGMTNRRDMIDEALLRPGRLEVQMEISLPDEKGRIQILNIHTSKMREYKKLAPDVDVEELATLTKNFSGAELEGLVRASQSSAMNRLVKAASKVEIDPNAIEKLQINRDDFMYALANDVKPAFGHSDEQVSQYLTRGIIVWGDPVRRILEDGELLVQQAKSPDTHGLVSVLLEGPPNSGKTALAAQIAKDSEFPFIKVSSPEDMIGFTEAAKCATLRKAFDDAYKSPLSVLLVDNLERLLDYGPVGPRYSNLVLQALLVLLKKQPPKGKRLLILATTSNRAVMEELEVLPAFSATLHISPLTTGDHILSVLEQSDVFSPAETQNLQAKLTHRRCSIGIRKLLDVIDLTRQTNERQRVTKFLVKLEEEGGLDMTS